MKVIESNTYDSAIFEGILQKSSRMKDLLSGVNSEVEETHALLHEQDFVEDLFSSLFKHKVQLREAASPSEILQRAVMEELQKNPKLAELRHDTVFDGFSSAMGTLALQTEVEKTLDSELVEQQEGLKTLQEEKEEAEKDFQTLLDSISDTAKKDVAESPLVQKQIKNLKRKSAQVAEKAEELAQSIQEKEHAIRTTVRTALKGACEQAEEMSTLMSGWGMQPGALTKGASIEQRFELADLMNQNPRMKDLANLIGRLKRLALEKQRSKTIHGRDEMYSVSIGDDLQRVVPTELAFLKNPGTKPEFYKKYSEKRLLQYELKGKELQGRGSIICCCDCSGSMKGGREDWAEAVSIALAEVAGKQKRDFVYIGFNRQIIEEITILKGEEEQSRIDKILSIARTRAAGGTSFDVPLKRAIEILQDEFPKADIVFITDGCCELNGEDLAEVKAAKKRLDFTVFGIQIAGLASSNKKHLKEFMDSVFSVSNVARDGDEALDGIFSKI